MNAFVFLILVESSGRVHIGWALCCLYEEGGEVGEYCLATNVPGNNQEFEYMAWRLEVRPCECRMVLATVFAFAAY